MNQPGDLIESNLNGLPTCGPCACRQLSHTWAVPCSVTVVNYLCPPAGGWLESRVLALMGVARGQYVYTSDLLELESHCLTSPLLWCSWTVCRAIYAATPICSLPLMCFRGWQTASTLAFITLLLSTLCIVTTLCRKRTPLSSQTTSRLRHSGSTRWATTFVTSSICPC